jgi:hypothetical protein
VPGRIRFAEVRDDTEHLIVSQDGSTAIGLQ